MIKIAGYILMLVLLILPANAATIHGTVYDISLRKLSNVRVDINTSPKQVIIVKNGSYSFNAPNGVYAIKAQLAHKNTIIASVQENISISQEGDYVLDLILFPEIEEGIEVMDVDIDENAIETERKLDIGLVILLLFLVLSALIVVFTYIKHKNKKKGIIEERIEDKYAKEGIIQEYSLENLINIIRQEGGRTTQKEIRKQIPLSEAKVSLMITELEHKGIIKKIKRGRGNVIILEKKE